MDDDATRSKKRWIVPSVNNNEQVTVPCATCHLCCQGHSLVALIPERGDDPAQFETAEFDKLTVLKHKPNGDCFYLGENGCTIHGKAPYMCRIYDCRDQHRSYTKAKRDELIKVGHLDKEVMRHAAILVHQEEKRASKSRQAMEDQIRAGVQQFADEQNECKS